MKHPEAHAELCDRRRSFDAEKRGAIRIEGTRPPRSHDRGSHAVADEDPA
jgi:hypothetical protein